MKADGDKLPASMILSDFTAHYFMDQVALRVVVALTMSLTKSLIFGRFSVSNGNGRTISIAHQVWCLPDCR